LSLLAILLLGLAVVPPAHGAAMVFIKKGDVWMARPDGSGQVPVTRDGRPGNPYFSPSISDNGTIVALRGIHLHSFRPGGQRIVRPRQWVIDPSPSASTESLDVDLSPNGRIVATDNALYGEFYDPRRSEDRPTLVARFVDFIDFRTNRAKGESDTFYDYGLPSWIDSRRVLTTSYGIFNAQVLEVRVGRSSRGTEFYRDPERDPNTGTNAFILSDVEMTRAGDRFAAMRRPLQGADASDLSVGTIQIYRTGNPSTDSTPLCTIGPGRRIGQDADPSWSPDGKTLLWWESRRGIFSTPVTSEPGCGLEPRRIVRGALTPDLSRAGVPRRRRG
jgi:WD40-like Beta Propeller Repeat